MNCTYNLKWSLHLGRSVPVSEAACARGKSVGGESAGRKAKGIGQALTAAVLLSAASGAWTQTALPSTALPKGAQVSAGQVTVNQSGSRLDIQQTTAKAIINWQSFDIGSNAQVRFNQPDANSVALNRVVGTDPSVIQGRLSANGQVFLLNANGVLFGSSARVDVGGLVASTLGISDSDFWGAVTGRYRLNGTSQNSVVNQGELTANAGGYIALLAPQVRNEGLVSATLGTVALAAGNAVTLQTKGQIGVTVDEGALQALIENKQAIRANDGRVILTARSSGALKDAVIRNDGTVEASSVSQVGGVIRLEADAVILDGALRADGSSGGDISIRAPRIGQSALLSAQGRGALTEGRGGNITLAAEQIIQSAGAELNVNSVQGQGGHIDVRALASDRSGKLFSSGQFNASGARGGKVLITGDAVDLYAVKVNASGTRGGGEVLIGGDFQGRNAAVPNAQNTNLNNFTTLRADATENGDGGKVVVWADQRTLFAGNISAKGGPQGGDGGAIEVSGKQQLGFAGVAQAGAAKGRAGTLLLDPKDITIEIVPPADVSALLPNPTVAAGDRHGTGITVLSNDNVVVSAPNDSFTGATAAGAVYLYNGATGALLSTLRGAVLNDLVGNAGITPLTNGNFVVTSRNWSNGGGNGNAGAVTWVNGTTGLSATVSPVNSLVGSQANDYVGISGGVNAVVALTNGNYVVGSGSWRSGSIGSVGAATWGNGTGGASNGGTGTLTAGVVTSANSLIGSTAGDGIGQNGITALNNGNYVVSSVNWDNGAAVDAGAVTWGNGALAGSRRVGVVSAANSLVGGTTSDPWAAAESPH